MIDILSVWPQAQILSAFGPWLSTNLTHQHVPCISDFAKDNPVYGSFVIGWISALQKHQARQQAAAAAEAAVAAAGAATGASSSTTTVGQQPLVLDGAECYTCTSELQVEAMKTWMKEGMATTDLVPVALKPCVPQPTLQPCSFCSVLFEWYLMS